MEITELIQSIQNNSWREMLSEIVIASDLDEDRQLAVSSKYLDFCYYGKGFDSSSRICVEDARTLLEIGMLQLLPKTRSLENCAEQIVVWFWGYRDKDLDEITIETVIRLYQESERWVQSLAIVTLAAIGTEKAMTHICELIRKYEINRMQPRFFSKISKNIDNAKNLILLLLSRSIGENGESMNLANEAMQHGVIDKQDLVPITEHAVTQIKSLLEKIEPLQQKHGKFWRFQEDYWELRTPLGVWIDFIGNMPDQFNDLSGRIFQLEDPYILIFAIQNLFKCGMEPAKEVCYKAASSHESRDAIYKVLKRYDRLDLFPEEFLTREAFAASSMVSWLIYPTELGYEPDVLELYAIVDGEKEDGEYKWCLWRFEDLEGKSYAGISGPYPVDQEPEPMRGNDTFSNFEEWDSKGPKEHLRSCLDTLNKWSMELCCKKH